MLRMLDTLRPQATDAVAAQLCMHVALLAADDGDVEDALRLVLDEAGFSRPTVARAAEVADRALAGAVRDRALELLAAVLSLWVFR
jgi:hypothetical protein